MKLKKDYKLDSHVYKYFPATILHHGVVCDAAFLPDITNILTSNGDGQVKVFDVASGEILYRFTGHKNKVNSISLSPGGDSFVSGSEDGAVKIWDLGNFQSDSHLPPGRLQHDILSKCPHKFKFVLLVQKNAI